MANLTGGIGYPCQTSEVVGTSDIKIALGTRARDAAGNEYVWCDFQTAFTNGEIVAISSAYAASEVGTSTTGKVGICCGSPASSDYAGWVQIYGTNSYALCNSGVTVGAAAVAATTDGYSVFISATTGISQIAGMTITTAPSTATSPGTATTASSILGVAAVTLNYPHVLGVDLMTS